MSFQKSRDTRPSLYVYDIPYDILSSLELKDRTAVPDQATEEINQNTTYLATAEAEVSTNDRGSPKSASCNTCGLIFTSHLDQRNHVRSDLHRYNTKRRLNELSPVPEDEFEELIANLQDEESESDTSDGSSDLDDDHRKRSRLEESKLNALFQKHLSLTETDNVTISSQSTRNYRNSRSPFYWFYSPKFPENIYLGIYRALFTHEEQLVPASLAEIVRRKQVRLDKNLNTSDAQNKLQIPAALRNGRHHFMCMIGGGHFAAMVVSVIPKVVKSSKGMVQRRATVIAHKSFHRYTTRRKQGGAQSANDSAKGAAHSAGASIRRHNEAALMNEVRELLLDWRDLISNSELLFVRATGSSNSKVLFGPYEGQILHRNDPRLRTFPFNTRRANQTELLRSFIELTRVKIMDSKEVDVDKDEEPRTTRSQNPATVKKEIKQVLRKSPHEELMEFHSSQLTSLIRRSKVSAVMAYFEKNSLPISFRFQSSEPQAREKNLTSLHIAASYNSHIIISALLLKLHADPSLVDANGKTAFEHCNSRQSRDAFRIARDELGETTWDWDAAKVPNPLKRKDIEERESQAKREADEQEANRRQSELHQLKLREEEQRRSGKITSGRKGKAPLLSENIKSPEEKRQEEVRGMTPAAIARLEREKRARAAEERMKRMQDNI